jgi:hypothetical protein
MELLKTLALFDHLGKWYRIDTIEYQGKWWLVPEWLACKDKKWKRPKLLISLDSFEYSKNDSGHPADFLISGSITKGVLDGKAPPERHLEVINNPDILFSLQIQ